MSDRWLKESRETFKLGMGIMAASAALDIAVSAIPAIRAFKTMKAIKPVVKVAKARKLGFRAK